MLKWCQESPSTSSSTSRGRGGPAQDRGQLFGFARKTATLCLAVASALAPGDERRLRQLSLLTLREKIPDAPYFGREGKFD